MAEVSGLPAAPTPDADAPRVFQPFPRQMLALMCPYDEILYGGAAGGGKTYWLGLDWSAHKATYGGNAKGLILRRTNPELEDLIRDLRGMFETLPDGPAWKEAKRVFEYRDGATLEMGYLEAEADVFRYQGRAWNWVGWDELTQHRKKHVYDYVGSRTRSAHGVKTRTLATTNPGGWGHDWVKKHWCIDRFPRGMVPIRTYLDLGTGKVLSDGPEPTELDGLSDEQLLERRIKRKVRVFIPSRLEDNPALDADGAYRAELMSKPLHLRQALLDGRWDIVEGAHFPEWNPGVHVVRPYTIPRHWKRWMGADWGTAKPYAIYWAAEAPDGKVVVYRELYGAKSSDEPHKGTLEPASLVAQRIRAVEKESGEHVLERYLDASCFSRDGHDLTIAQLFAKEGVHFQPSLKKNKAGGITNLREYLKVVNGMSRLAVFDTCHHLIRTLPELISDENNPELYDSKGEDHCLSSDTVVVTASGKFKICDLVYATTPLRVWTPVGWRDAHSVRKTGEFGTYTVTLSNGKTFSATGNHRFLVAGRGFVEVDRINRGDTLLYEAKNGPDDCFRDHSGVSRCPVLPVRVLLPAQGGEAAPAGMGNGQWPDPRWFSRSPQEREPVGQFDTESRIEAWARALEPAHDARTSGLVANQRQEGHQGGSSVASFPSWSSLAPRARGASRAKDQGTVGVCEPDQEGLLHVHGDLREQGGIVLLQGDLQDSGSQARYHGVIVEEIRFKAIEPVYDLTVEDAHCFLIEPGVFAHNCVDALLYLLRRNTPDEDEQKRRQRRSSGPRYGEYGVF